MLFNKYGGENVGVKHFMSHFSMFFPTKANVKLANGNKGHAQVIEIILCCFPNLPIIYPLGPVYYWPCNTPKTISSGDLKFYVGFQKVTYEPVEHFYFVDPQGHSQRSPYQTKKNIVYIKTKIFRVNPQRNMDIVVQTICALSK